jgi:peptidoglycan/LPS O-acetylase OafA/YrhL
MKGELTALTGLRFWAAFLVFLFHVNMRTKMLFLPWPVYNIVSHGAFGVTIFFVLSGFLLTYSHTKDFPDGEMQEGQYMWRFMYKRFARIYPPYLVALFLFAGACMLFGASPSPGVLLADLSMTEAAFPGLAMQWYGSGAWSVSIEIFFYLFFPWLLPLLLRIKRPRTLWLLLAADIALGTFGGLSFRFWPEHVSYALMYATPLFRCSEFIAGMIASLLVFRFGWRMKEGHAIAMVAVAGAYIAGFGPKLTGFVAHNWLVLPAIVSLLAAMVDIKQTRFLRLLFTPSWIQYAGRVSYCFYLVQLPLFAIQDMRAQTHVLPWWSGPITFLITCFVAALLHHYVEGPAHRWLLAKLSRRRLVAA